MWKWQVPFNVGVFSSVSATVEGSLYGLMGYLIAASQVNVEAAPDRRCSCLACHLGGCTCAALPASSGGAVDGAGRRGRGGTKVALALPCLPSGAVHGAGRQGRGGVSSAMHGACG